MDIIKDGMKVVQPSINSVGLTELKTDIDASGIGFNADKLDGMHAVAFEEIANKNQANGYAGLGADALVQGSIPFADADGKLAQNNADLKWDDAAKRLELFGNLSLCDADIDHENITHQPVYLSGQTGLDDLNSSGTYTETGNAVFQIRIDSEGTPDEFKWRKGATDAWLAAVAITGASQLLQDGISIQFTATTGHSEDDEWEINVGHEIHISEAIHVNADITADGDLVVLGALRSLSPVRIAGGLKLLCDAVIETDCDVMELKVGGANSIIATSTGITIPGNLLVQGTTTTYDTDNILIKDPLMLLAKGNVTDALDIGFIGKRASSNIGFIWDDSIDEFAVIETTDDGSTAGNVSISSYANFHAKDIKADGNVDITGVIQVASINANGSKVLVPVGVDTATNEFTVTNAASDNDPEISVTGMDDNIGIKMTPKGTGGIGIGVSASSILHIKANIPGTVGSHPAGQLIIQDPDDSVFGNAVITGYESDGSGNPNQQLWYLGSSSVSNSDIEFRNRRNSKLSLGTNDTIRMTILGDGKVGVGATYPDRLLHVESSTALTNTVSYAEKLSHITSGTPAANIGVGIEFEVETSSGNNEVLGTIEVIATDVGVGAEDGDMVFKTMTAGVAPTAAMRITSGGDVIVADCLRVSNEITLQSDGSASDPGYTWEDDLDTGLYRLAENTMGFSAGGSEILRMTSAEIYASKRLKLTGGAILFSATDLEFGSGNSTAVKMTLKSDGTLNLLGNVTIPTTFTMNDGTTNRFDLSATDTEMHSPDGTEYIRITDTAIWMYTTDYVLPGGTSGTVGLGNASWLWKDVWAVNGTIQTSDRRDKDNILDINYGLDTVKQLRPVTYKWKESEDDKIKIGLIAQEVLDVIPEAIQGNEKEHYGINYGELVPVLIKAIQDLSVKINEMDSEIKRIKI